MKKQLFRPVLVMLLLLPALCSLAQLGVKVKTYPGVDKNKIWLMATAGTTSTGLPSIDTLKKVKLSSLSNDSFYINKGFSGRIYFFINISDSSQIPSTASAISLDTTLKIRFDWVEMTYLGGPYDCVNLTSVDQFGIALSMATYDSNNHKTGSLGYKVSANTLISSLHKIAPASVFRYKGQFIRAMSPLHTSAYPSLGYYFNMLAAGKDSIALFDQVLQTTAVYVNKKGDTSSRVYPAKYFYFTSTMQGTDSIELKSHTSVAADNNFFHGRIKISKKDLKNMIYACDGPFTVYPYAGKDTSYTDYVGFNDPWSSVVRNFIVGFNTGYYGYKTKLSGGYQVNGNRSWDWNPNFAFKNNLKGTANYNQYARVIDSVSNSYGFPFSDFISKPLLPLPGAASLHISVLSDSVVNLSDYVQPAATPKADTTNPVITDGTNLIVKLNLGEGQPDCYTGPVTFYGKSFANGWDYTNLDTARLNPTTKGDITFTIVPYKKGKVNKYTFTVEGKPFSLYLKIDSTGKVKSAIMDNPAVGITIGPQGNSVTLFNLLFAISPAYLKNK